MRTVSLDSNTGHKEEDSKERSSSRQSESTYLSYQQEAYAKRHQGTREANFESSVDEGSTEGVEVCDQLIGDSRVAEINNSNT